MNKIGIISPSEIAFRRFLPALQKSTGFQFVGVAIASKQEWYGECYTGIADETWQRIREGELKKAQSFVNNYGGEIFESYESLITDSKADCIYTPLPPALHYRWAKLGLESSKHVFIEKPSTPSLCDTSKLIDIARLKGLALHENYMFAYHNQLQFISDYVSSGEIGDVRLYRIFFGFPMRQLNDFRYNKALGGGALLDCGGYTLKYASILLGDTAKLDYAKSNYTDRFKVDLYGSAALSNDKGITVQVAFGMDNNYKCELEVWGSKGCFYTNRMLTAPDGFVPEAIIRKGNEEKKIVLPADDTFSKSIQVFKECIISNQKREEEYQTILRQATLVDEFITKSI